jgi:hypothetical protein
MLTPVSKPDSPSTSRGKAARAGPSTPPSPPATGGEPVGPGRQRAGVGEDFPDADDDDHRVERQEDDDERNGDDHRLGEAEQEHPAQDQQQPDGQRDGVTLQEGREERVLENVDRRVRRRQRDRDDP